ncbi:hypothetical protein PT974_11652 [Cladobotryum mycophilum]|uniref:Pre-mRNA splicing factor n=1 Tax=Cladobotryum mycophilum TaxID=491253 RepID=A0ABR0S5U0_9HYPO
MTRVYIYSAALVAFVAATVMILVAITEPNWVSYSVTTPQGHTFEKHIGLARSCSTLGDPECRSYPYKELCQDGGRYFCSMWRTVSFIASFAVILCLVNLITFALILGGGKYKRETGWPFIGAMLTMIATLQFIIISIVAYLYDNDDQFTIPGWKLDVSWYLSTVSGAICLITAAGLAASAYLLPREDGYYFLEDPLDA